MNKLGKGIEEFRENIESKFNGILINYFYNNIYFNFGPIQQVKKWLAFRLFNFNGRINGKF